MTGIPDVDQVTRARSMFEFLRDVQRLRTTTPRRLDEYRRADGLALSEDELRAPSPDSWLETPAFDGDWDLTAPLCVIPRRPESRCPVPPRGIAAFLRATQGAKLDDPNAGLTVAQELIDAVEGGTISAGLQGALDGMSPGNMLGAAEHYLSEWETWASGEQHDRAIRRQYKDVFRAHESAANDPHSWEFLLGVGRLTMPATDYREAVDRPVLVVPLIATTQGRTGSLELRIAPGATFRVETDMLAVEDLTRSPARGDLEKLLSATPAEELARAELAEALREFVNHALIDVRFIDEAEGTPDAGAVMTMGPVVILRKRSQAATIRALEQVVSYLTGATEVPSGLAPLVDPSKVGVVPTVEEHNSEGAVVTRGSDRFTPLPLNDKQWNVVRRADSRPLTLVQGPPGTGKTHTTAALISHLLAQGKRILVTAHNPAALGEVKSKLPAEIQSLAVSVVGSGQQEMSELRSAIDGLSRRASDFDRDENTSQIRDILAEIELDLDARESLIAKLVESRRRESETRTTPFGSYTLAELAERWREGKGRYEWARPVLPDPAGLHAELGLNEIPRLQSQLRLLADDPQAQAANALAASVDQIEPPDSIDQLVADHAELTRELRALDTRADDRVLRQAGDVSSDVLTTVASHVQELLELVQTLRARPESWVGQALADIAAGRTRTWELRLRDVERRLEDAHALNARLQAHQPIVHRGDEQATRTQISTILTWLDTGATMKMDSTGRPKVGMLAPKAVKEAWPIWGELTLRGRPAADRQALETAAMHFDLEDQLRQLDQAWPAGTPVSTEDSPAERLAWHEDECDVLRQVLGMANATASARLSVQQLPGAYPLNWIDESAVSAFLDGLTLIETRRHLSVNAAALDRAAARVLALGSASVASTLRQAVLDHDPDAYRSTYNQIEELIDLRDRGRTARERLESLRERVPRLAAMLPVPNEADWIERFGQLEEAWSWLRLDSWLRKQEDLDPNQIQADISAHEDELRRKIGQLAALRAWGHAVERLTPERRADLQAYVTLVRRLGKGTGKYANQRRAEIQEVLSRCRSSVPVWVMPLFRMFDSVEMKPDSFDAIIIDEASQASLESLVLQFLAPKVVVVGDDKQVSPSVVGLDLAPVQALADTYLRWSPQRSLYKDPNHSLFDEAKTRFPDLITLTEHRRCVPEIIGFSDMIAYRSDGVPLVPVRETGAAALPPIKVSLVPGGEVATRGKKVNRAEQDAVVAEILRCVADPAYEGKTLGVISLLGSDQSKQIMERIIQEVDPDEIQRRQIRCGEAPEFQGAERDVILLTMVAAPNANFTALTAMPYVQRFNVAVSRARDQLHLFHSLDPANPHLRLNPEDLRFRLISYMSERVTDPEAQSEPSPLIPEDAPDVRVPRGLRRRVYNYLARHGYHVEPRYNALGHPVDLAVVGSTGKAAIQCIDSTAVDEADYRRTLAHETELMRVGWRIHRIRESALAIDPDRVEAEFVAFLSASGIEPAHPPVDLTH